MAVNYSADAPLDKKASDTRQKLTEDYSNKMSLVVQKIVEEVSQYVNGHHRQISRGKTKHD